MTIYLPSISTDKFDGDIDKTHAHETFCIAWFDTNATE